MIVFCKRKIYAYNRLVGLYQVGDKLNYMNFKQYFYPVLGFVFLLILVMSCQKSADTPTPGAPVATGTNGVEDPWLIPKERVFDGGPGQDGIPSIDQPNFSRIESVNFLKDDDLVIGIKVGDDIRAYPHSILDYHEIVNDHIGDNYFAITYCPLTGSAIAWNRELNGEVTTFGVSGLLYNTNLIPYDRLTNSLWSQMLLTSVNGPLINTQIETYPLVEMSWSTWKMMFPESEVLNTQTGFDRDYSVYPYGGYKTNHDQLLFPIDREDVRFSKKDRGLGIVAVNQAQFYGFRHFSKETRVLNRDFAGMEIVVVGSEQLNFIVAYKRRVPNGGILRFTVEPEVELPVIMTDEGGSQWNIFGEAVSGPLLGSKLEPVTSYIGFWFAWTAFYQDVQTL